MLKTPILHPDVLLGLGRLGHGSKVLLSDGNFPHATATPPTCHRVFLNYAPGLINATDILGPLLDTLPVERAEVMQPNRDGPYAMQDDPPIFAEYQAMLAPHGVDTLDPLERFAFYDAAREPDVGLLIATGEQRIYANLLLTIGVVKPD
ncbi:MAG: RbsD/FucU family protein [Planctomycetota bacterium]